MPDDVERTAHLSIRVAAVALEISRSILQLAKVSRKPVRRGDDFRSGFIGARNRGEADRLTVDCGTQHADAH
jgi:hypothetical protein